MGRGARHLQIQLVALWLQANLALLPAPKAIGSFARPFASWAISLTKTVDQGHVAEDAPAWISCAKNTLTSSIQSGKVAFQLRQRFHSTLEASGNQGSKDLTVESNPLQK